MNIHYLAGLVDGEGYIRLCPSNKGKYRKYYPQLQVTNTYKPLLESLVSDFGGSILGPKRSKNATKDCWDWRISGDKARKLLHELLPLLVIKKDKAKQVLEGDNKKLNKLVRG